MFTKFAHLTGRLTGCLLGSFAVSAQLGNVLICMAVLLFGPAVTIGFLGQ